MSGSWLRLTARAATLDTHLVLGGKSGRVFHAYECVFGPAGTKGAQVTFFRLSIIDLVAFSGFMPGTGENATPP